MMDTASTVSIKGNERCSGWMKTRLTWGDSTLSCFSRNLMPCPIHLKQIANGNKGNVVVQAQNGRVGSGVHRNVLLLSLLLFLHVLLLNLPRDYLNQFHSSLEALQGSLCVIVTTTPTANSIMGFPNEFDISLALRLVL